MADALASYNPKGLATINWQTSSGGSSGSSAPEPKRRTTNIDLQSVWGEPIPILWGNTRVNCLPIWSSVPVEKVENPAPTTSGRAFDGIGELAGTLTYSPN